MLGDVGSKVEMVGNRLEMIGNIAEMVGSMSEIGRKCVGNVCWKYKYVGTNVACR